MRGFLRWGRVTHTGKCLCHTFTPTPCFRKCGFPSLSVNSNTNTAGKTGDDAKRYQERSVSNAVDAAEEQEKASEGEKQS